MTSGGLRREAMTNLKYGDVQGIAHDGKLTAAKVIADNEFRERYIKFVTPEEYIIF